MRTFSSIVLTLGAICALANGELRVGVLYSASGIYAPYGLTVPPITTEWARWRGDVQPIFCDVASNATKATLCAMSVIAQGAAVITAPETALTTPVAVVAKTYGVPVIAGMGATSDIFFTAGVPTNEISSSRRFSNLYGVMTPSQNYFDILLPFLVTKGLRSVTIITTPVVPDIDVCRGADSLARELNLPVQFLTLSSNMSISTAISLLATEHSDILIVCNFLGCPTTLGALAAQQYTPKAIAMFECANSIATLKNEDAVRAAKYIFTPAQWDRRVRGSTFSDASVTRRNYANMFPVDRSTLTSAQQFWDRLKNISTLTPTSLAASQMVSLYTIDAATKACNCTDASGILAALPLINFASFFGTVRFNDNGQNDLHEMVIQQVGSDYTIEIVSPLTSTTMDAIVPIPTFQERVYSYQPFTQNIEKAVLGTAITTAIVCGIVAGIVLIKRDHPLIRGTSYPFLVISLLGAALLSLATLTWRLDGDDNDCQSRIVTFTMGFLLLLTPWIAKTIRVWLIFEHKTLTHKYIPHSSVGLLSLALGAPSFLVMILWYALAPLQATYYIVDILRPAYNYNECAMPDSVYLYLSIALLIVLIIGGIVFAVAISHVEDRFNDARAMMAVIYNITVWLTVILITQITQSSRYASFIVRSFGLQFSVISSIVVFYQRIDSYERAQTDSKTKSGTGKIFIEVQRTQKMNAGREVVTTGRTAAPGEDAYVP